MNINKQYCTNKNKYATNNVKEIIVHYTGNPDTTAAANAKFFALQSSNSSAHYVVDEKGVWQVIDEKYGAFHAGNLSVNKSSIGIEICCHKIDKRTLYASDKDWYFDNKTLDNVIELIKDIRSRYGNIPIRRHFDVTGKICPAPFVHSNTLYQDFLVKANNVSKNEEQKKNFLVRVKITDLNIRQGAGVSYKSNGYIKPGVYTIVETKGTWGRLKSGAGWISLNYVERL